MKDLIEEVVGDLERMGYPAKEDRLVGPFVGQVEQGLDRIFTGTAEQDGCRLHVVSP